MWLTRRLALPLAFAMFVAGARASHADDGAIARGKYLYDAADCGGCHGGDFDGGPPSGGLGLDTPFGRFYVPNITPDQKHGIGAWSEKDFRRAIREGIAADGEHLFPVFPFTSFTNMSDSDAGDLFAYLMSVPAVAKANKPHEVKPPFGWRSLLVFWRALFFTAGPIKTEPTKDAVWNRGNYLVHAVVHCEECHTPRNIMGATRPSLAFSGNVGGPDGQNAPNITSDRETGIGDWKIEDVERVLKSGMTPDSDMLGSGMKAVVRGTSKLTDADRHAIAVYLVSVAPIHTKLQQPKPTP